MLLAEKIPPGMGMLHLLGADYAVQSTMPRKDVLPRTKAFK